MPAFRPVVVALVVVAALGIPRHAMATMYPSPIRLAALFDRPQWRDRADHRPAGPTWHVAERLEQ